ncbi:MAG: ferredoxin [Thiohalocapsa sp.]
MTDSIKTLITLRINGKDISAPQSLSVIQALWYAGYPRVKGVGCMQGVCGSCRVFVRRADSNEIATELGCELLIDEGMDVHFLSYPIPPHQTYQLEEIPSSWEVQAKFHDIFPEAAHCRHCGGCNTTCPKAIDVEKGVDLAVTGRFGEAGELFVECVMCNLCQTACPELITPNHVALFSRRVTAYFHTRPSNLIHRLEMMRKGELRIIE